MTLDITCTIVKVFIHQLMHKWIIL